MADILDRIKRMPFSNKNYVDQVFEKKMIFLHHTASDGDPFGVVQWWSRGTDKVSTPFLIARGTTSRYDDGDVFQLFPSNRGCWHLGVTAKHLAVGGPAHASSTFLNMNSVGIEVTNWGGLVLKNGKYITYAGNAVPENQIQEYPNKFRGFQFYEKYTTAQLDNLGELVLFLCKKYAIPSKWVGMNMFDISPDCLRGTSGVWTHCSVRPATDKQDMHPQPELIQMLGSL